VDHHDRATSVIPGLLVAALLTALATALNTLVPFISALTFAVLGGVILGNRSGVDRFRPGLMFAARTLLRFGVVLLGVRLSIGQVTELGAATLAVVVATVTATFFGTRWLGERLGVSEPLTLLIATGYSICGASAIAAMEDTSDAEEEEVAMAIGLVTLAGTIAMFALPLLAMAFGFSDEQFGIWVGASVHDVAQVVAAASTGGASVLAIAVVVKLTRVILLAPLVAGVSLARRSASETTDRPPVLPPFVIGFLAMLAFRSTGWVPEAVVDGARFIEGLLLTVALVGLGAAVRIDRLRQLGGAPLALGAIASVLVGGVSLAATLLI
jgi:uncharacterized integral membrane protein (TIGR00698 family)